MSVQRIETVKKCRKAQGKCSRCGTPIEVGDGYLYWYPGFRSNYKIVRCLKKVCFPAPSERETSKAATILQAQETFENLINQQETVEDIETAVQEVAEAVAEVRDEYQEALDAWENGNEQLQEKVDHYDDQASQIDGWQWDGASEPERCQEYAEEGHDEACSECEDLHEQWIQEVREAASDAVQNVETM